MKKILIAGLIAGCILFVVSYGGLFLGIRFFPGLFELHIAPIKDNTGKNNPLYWHSK
jgi:hypothetical protein